MASPSADVPQDEAATPPDPAPATKSASTDEVPQWVRDVVSWARRKLRRRRTRTVLIGIVLVLAGALVVDDSVWTLPLLIVGGVMIVSAWLGSRLEGQVTIDWGADGAGFELRSRLKPDPEDAPAQLAAPAAAPKAADAEAEHVADADVVEGEAHTTEIDVGALKALIAEVERVEATMADDARFSRSGNGVAADEAKAG